MSNNEKIEQLYKEAVQAVEKAKEYSLRIDQLSDTEKAELDRFTQQADEQIKMAKQLEAILEADLAIMNREAEVKRAAQKKEEKTAEPKFAHGGEFMVAIYNSYKNAGTDERLKLLEPVSRKALSGEVGVAGGFLLPTQQNNEILQVVGQQSLVRQYATQVPMGARTVQWPAIDYSRGAAGVNAFSGGITVGWTEENVAATESQPYFKAVELHARELKGLCLVPNSLLRDSPVSLQSYFSGDQGFGGALAAEIDYKAINGQGAGSPKGILNAPAKLTVSRSSANTFKYVDAVTMLSKLLITSRGKARWLINQSVMPQLLQFSDAANQNIFLANAAMAPEGSLLGLPIDWDSKNPVLGTAGDVMLIDWSYYLLGDRQVMLMEVDSSFQFGASQTAFKATMSLDGQPWVNSTIKLMDGSTIVSPFVVLS